MMHRTSFQLAPDKRILFLTKDLNVIRQQLEGQISLSMADLSVSDLLDDINTDAMTPAWACFDYEPDKIARNAYAGFLLDGERVFPEDSLKNGNFDVIVSGERKGVGSSRETAAQCEAFSGIRLAIAASFAPIHARNNINIGQLMGDHSLLEQIEAGVEIPIDMFTQGYDPVSKMVVHYGGLFPLMKAIQSQKGLISMNKTPKRAMTMGEKILAKHRIDGEEYVVPGESIWVHVDGGYSHEFTTAQVHWFLEHHYGKNYQINDPSKFAVFEDHLIYADDVPRMVPFGNKIEVLREMQRHFQQHTDVKDYSAQQGVSPGICHQVAREKIIEPGDFIQATDSHTCMGGGSNALAWGVGATEYAALISSGMTAIEVPESICFVLQGTLNPSVAAKDVMLFILKKYARNMDTLNRIMEFVGEGLQTLSPDERATLANMATECTARSAIVEGDERLLSWLKTHRSENAATLKQKFVFPDKNANYAGGVHTIDLSTIEPMVATPGIPEQGIVSDPTNGMLIRELDPVFIDIAYGGSCTAGKIDDVDMYAQVITEAVRCSKKVATNVQFILQFGSRYVADYAEKQGYIALFKQAGVQIIAPGCGACIGCGPGVSETEDQITVSAINRNYNGRSGPGQLYLASPLTVAASAFEGKIVAYSPGMFEQS